MTVSVSTSAPSLKPGYCAAKFNVHWKKDRGKNPDGTERHNNTHHTLVQKQQARSGNNS